jgi:hypothetical protein
MPRIRSIKPEFWTDGAMISLPFEVRLFYIGMWNFACDRGHLSDDPMGLKLKILPADTVSGSDVIEMLVGSGRVERITLADGRRYLNIPRFTDHQRIDSRWNSRCPVCAHIDSHQLTETHASLGELIPGGEGRGEEGKGEGGESADAPLSPFCPKHPHGTERPCRACGTARMAFEAAKAAEKSRPTPIPRRAATCPDHPEWPMPCQKCADIAAEEVA